MLCDHSEAVPSSDMQLKLYAYLCRSNVSHKKRGIQYASPEAIRDALSYACVCDKERKEFSREDLEDMGLVQGNGGRVSTIDNVWLFFFKTCRFCIMF